MRETGIVAAVLGALAAMSLAIVLSFDEALMWASAVVAVGFSFGVPTAVVYHVQLYRVLHRRGALPRGWYWRPLRLNDTLRDEERPRVLPWCWAGGLGLLVIVLGLLMVGARMVATSLELAGG